MLGMILDKLISDLLPDTVIPAGFYSLYFKLIYRHNYKI